MLAGPYAAIIWRMVQLAIRCHPCVPISVTELEGWLAEAEPLLAGRKGPRDMSRQAIAASVAGVPNFGPSLDRVLELIERRQLSATELRLLLHLVDRDASLRELADALGQQRVNVRRAGRSLAMRGLVRWLHVGRRKETRFGITANGLATIRAFLTEAGQAG